MTPDRTVPSTVPPSNVTQQEVAAARPSLPAALRLLRPQQWIKNLLVLAPLIFSGLFLNMAAIEDALLATGMFCLAASAGYVYNDLQDIEADRRHPVKRHTRPLAAGDLTPFQGWSVLGAVLLALAGGALLVPWTVTAALAGYLAIGVAYSSGMKQVAVLDLFVISAGFVFRVFAGAEAIGVGLSAWMAVTTLCLALYLGTVKRLAELDEHGDDARSVLNEYTSRTLEGFALISATLAVVFYALYTAFNRPSLAITLPFVLFGFFRYWHLVRTSPMGSAPIRDAISDKPLVGVVGAWTIANLYLLWPG